MSRKTVLRMLARIAKERGNEAAVRVYWKNHVREHKKEMAAASTATKSDNYKFN